MPALIAGVSAAADDMEKWKRIWREANVRNVAYLPYDASLGVPSIVRSSHESCDYCATKYVLSDVQVRCPSCGAPPRERPMPVVFDPLYTHRVEQGYEAAHKAATIYGRAFFRPEMAVKVKAD